jgi:UDP-glucose 4-epimerase
VHGGLAKKAGVARFVFSSSCSNYGKAGEGMIDETGALNPVTAYGESKVNSERASPDLTETASVQSICGRRRPTACRRDRGSFTRCIVRRA